MAPTATASMIAGATSGAACTVLLQPLETLKTRRQVTPSPQPSYAALARRIIAERGPQGLWAGLTPALLRTVPGVGLYFAGIGLLRPRRDAWRPADHPWHNVAAGAAARGGVALLLLPLTVVKARMESGRYGYPGVVSALRQIYASEGARGLFAGMGATLARDAPFSGLYLAAYEGLKPHVVKAGDGVLPLPAAHLLSGLVAGGAASLVTHPADVVKTRMQVGNGSTGVSVVALPQRAVAVLVAAVRAEGPCVLLQGAAPRVLRRALVAAINWTAFEELVAAVDRTLRRL